MPIRSLTAYDGHWTTVYPSVGAPTRSRANATGQVIATDEWNTTWANERTTTYAYDLNGNLAAVRYPRGNRPTYVTDNLGRQTTMTDPDRGLVSYTYNLDGSLATAADATAMPTAHWIGTTSVGRRLTSRRSRLG